MTPAELEKLAEKYGAKSRRLETEIMEDIVRRIKINGEITSSADWQINRLQQLGVGRDEIDKAIKKGLNISQAELEALYTEVAKTDYVRNAELYKAKGLEQIPFEDNLQLQQLIQATAKQTADEMQNVTQSLGFMRADGTFEPIGTYYQNTLDNALGGITSGAFDYNTAVKKAVVEMANSGLRSVDYASGHTNRIDVATRRAVMTGLGQVTNRVNEANMQSLGTEYVEVTYHGGARPTHQVWQGKVFKWNKSGSRATETIDGQEYPDFETSTGYGTGDGLGGWNCYHSFFPFIPGASERIYTDDELERMNAQENTPREYNGKKYTVYEALQKQRQMETLMRSQREKAHLLQVVGGSEDDINSYKTRYNATMNQYAEFSKAMHLPQQRGRIAQDGLGRVFKPGKVKTTLKPQITTPKPTNPTQKNTQKSTNTKPTQAYAPPTDKIKAITGKLDSMGVEKYAISKHAVQPTDDEIIDRIAGGDMTGGSCSSVALAYAGQRRGFDVGDFRGGASRSFFGGKQNKVDMWRSVGAKTICEESARTNLTNGKRILQKVEPDKVYYLSVGKHASIVRKIYEPVIDDYTGEVLFERPVLQYLELQSPYSNNGWHNFDRRDPGATLKWRFAVSSSSRGGINDKAYLTDLDSLTDDDFINILEYINTPQNKQWRGKGGSVK